MSELPTQSATQEGRILGTVAYMSPEQAEGKTIDHRSDIFSMGIILYEMATGERPFKGDTTASILSSIIKEHPTSVTEVNPDCPADPGKDHQAMSWSRIPSAAIRPPRICGTSWRS